MPLVGGVLPFPSLSELGQVELSMGSFFLAGGNESALCCFFLWLCSMREHQCGALCREAQDCIANPSVCTCHPCPGLDGGILVPSGPSLGLWGSTSASDLVLPVPIKQAWEHVCLGCLSSLQTRVFLATQQAQLTFPVSMGTESDCSQTTY